ncbi:unnamed protein product, partial [Brenthis ino]
MDIEVEQLLRLHLHLKRDFTNAMELDTPTIIIISVFSAAWLLLFILCLVLFSQVASLRRKVTDLSASGRLRVQKLTMSPDRNHAFHNPGLTPDEELTRRGYSMYKGADDDVESGRGTTDRQTGGQFLDDLTREIDRRSAASAGAPPFLLNGIEDNKKTRNPVANGRTDERQNVTNSNFIY